MVGWALFAHDADVGVRGVGPTREAAFEQGAIALMHTMGAGSDVAPRQMVSIACEAPNDEVLFVDWLRIHAAAGSGASCAALTAAGVW